LLEVAGPLQEAGLVIEDGGDQPSLNSLPTSGRILQYFFGLIEVDSSFGVALIIDAGAGLPIESFQFGIKFFCVGWRVH
jgi:hypothetical protein